MEDACTGASQARRRPASSGQVWTGGTRPHVATAVRQDGCGGVGRSGEDEREGRGGRGRGRKRRAGGAGEERCGGRPRESYRSSALGDSQDAAREEKEEAHESGETGTGKKGGKRARRRTGKGREGRARRLGERRVLRSFTRPLLQTVVIFLPAAVVPARHTAQSAGPSSCACASASCRGAEPGRSQTRPSTCRGCGPGALLWLRDLLSAGLRSELGS